MDRDWSKYDRQNVVFQPRHFTPQELQEKIFWAYRQTYNLRSLWQRRPFSFQHFSLYLVLNFGYMKGLKKMEKEVMGGKKTDRRPWTADGRPPAADQRPGTVYR